MRNEFQSALFKSIDAYIRQAKANGTVSMSLGCLMQCVKSPSPSLNGSPKGTNARYFYASHFREIVEQGRKESSAWRKFIEV